MSKEKSIPVTISETVEIKNEHKEEPEETKDKKHKKFTCKQKVALVMLATVDFMSFCSMSIMAPFYPQEAATKGMSESMAGFVFGFYALVVFLSSPVFGKILPKIGLKCLFTGGVLISGICSLVFGTLHIIDNYALFTTFSFLIRGLEALGASAYSTASYVIIVNIFPDNAGAVRGLLETFVGLGMSVGPALGGLLFAEDRRFRSTILRNWFNYYPDSTTQRVFVAIVRKMCCGDKERLFYQTLETDSCDSNMFYNYGHCYDLEFPGPDSRTTFAKVQVKSRQYWAYFSPFVGNVWDFQPRMGVGD